MGRIVVTEFISLDGVIEAPGGTEDYKHVNWTFEFNWGEAGDRFKDEENRASEALLLGRVTYQEFAKAWPHVEGEFADKFNSMPHYVVSSTLEEPLSWNNSRLLTGDLIEEVTKLKDEATGDIVVHGSGQLARELLQQGLVDQLRLMIYPVILGSGKRLFGELDDKQRWRLVESKAAGDGIMILIYEPAA
jgi:dihydrofolate reductase